MPQRSSGGRVVELMACGAGGPGFDSRPRHLNFQRLVISCFQVAIWLKHCWSDVNPQYNQPTNQPSDMPKISRKRRKSSKQPTKSTSGLRIKNHMLAEVIFGASEFCQACKYDRVYWNYIKPWIDTVLHKYSIMKFSTRLIILYYISEPVIIQQSIKSLSFVYAIESTSIRYCNVYSVVE